MKTAWESKYNFRCRATFCTVQDIHFRIHNRYRYYFVYSVFHGRVQHHIDLSYRYIFVYTKDKS